MARSYRVAKPTTGKGQADVVFARGGGGRPPKMPSAPRGLTIDLNLEGMREKSAHQARLKELQDSGLYEGVDLSLIPADKVALLHANLAKDLRSSAEGKLQSDRAREGGTFLQDQARLSGEPPRHFIGSEYERTKSTLDSPGARDLGTLNPMTGEFEDIGKYTDPSGKEGELRGPPFLEYGPEDLVEFFGMGEGGGLKKNVHVDEGNLKHGSDTEFYKDTGAIKRDSEFNRGVETSRIEYDRSGNIEKTKGDPFGTGSDKIPEKNLTRVEEDLANFLGIDPSFVTKDMYTSRTQFQKELEKPDKVIDAFKNTKEVTRYDPETNQTYVKWIKKGTGKVVGKEILIPTDPEKGYYTTTFDDDRGKNIVTLDRVGNIDRLITIPKNLKEKSWNPQVLLLADFLKDGILEESYGGRSFKELSAPEQGALMTKAFKDARNPAQYVYSHPEIITPLREFSKEKGKLEQITDLIEAVAKLGSNEGNQGNTLRDKFNTLKKR